MKKLIKENKGITLIALVITIIVLLILAGITVTQLSNNGLFDKARIAKEKWEDARKLENSLLGEYENEIGTMGSARDSIPVILDENEHEIGMLGNKKLYQKTFINREINITTSDRTWYTAIQNTEFSELNADIIFLDESSSFIKSVMTKGANAGQISYYCLNTTFGNGYIHTNITKNGNGFFVSQLWNGIEATNSTNGYHFYNTITIRYTKTTD